MFSLHGGGVVVCADSAWPGGGCSSNRGFSGTVGAWYCRRGDADCCYSGLLGLLPIRGGEKNMESLAVVEKLAVRMVAGDFYCIGDFYLVVSVLD